MKSNYKTIPLENNKGKEYSHYPTALEEENPKSSKKLPCFLNLGP